MSLYLGVKERDILQSQGALELIDECRGILSRKMKYLDAEGQLSMLKGVIDKIDMEMAFEDRIDMELAEALADLESLEREELGLRHRRLNEIAGGYFERRGAVYALQEIVTRFRDLLIGRALVLAEREVSASDPGCLPAPYCCLLAGSGGRLEETLTPELSAVIVHGGDDASARWFAPFSRTFSAIAAGIGFKILSIGIGTEGEVPCGGREWWRRTIDDLLPQEEEKGVLQLLADLRPIHGAVPLGEELMGTVRKSLDDPELIAALAKKAAVMPVALSFMGRLKVERTGPHRGEWSITVSALTPLVVGVRIMSVMAGVAETNTVDRIRSLQGQGRLDVDLSERLLRAYHDFYRILGLTEFRRGIEGEGGFITPEQLAEEDEYKLKNGLEAVANLQRIIYSTVVA